MFLVRLHCFQQQQQQLVRSFFHYQDDVTTYEQLFAHIAPAVMAYAVRHLDSPLSDDDYADIKGFNRRKCNNFAQR